MRRHVPLLIALVMLLSACGTTATPEPTPVSTPTITRTATVSSAELTAAATFRATLPPTFTPTFTPSPTLTPSQTLTPSMTPTPTTIPEAVLCESFTALPLRQPSDRIYRDAPFLLEVFTEYTTVRVFFELFENQADTPFFSGQLDGGGTGLVEILLDDLPDSGNYRWQVTLLDDERDGLCPIDGTFSAEMPPTATPQPPAEATPDVTGESTAEVTPEASAETTDEP